MAKATKYLKCPHCNWLHFPVTREYAEAQVQLFNEYFKKLSKKEQKDLYGGNGASIKKYERCFRCNNSYRDFVVAKAKDVPVGSTIQPIIKE